MPPPKKYDYQIIIFVRMVNSASDSNENPFEKTKKKVKRLGYHHNEIS